MSTLASYVNCLSLSLDFLEEISRHMPACDLKIETQIKFRLYRNFITRQYQTPVTTIDPFFDNLLQQSIKKQAVEDFSTILNGIILALTKEAQRRINVFTRESTLRNLPVRRERIVKMKFDLKRLFYVYINRIDFFSFREITDMVTNSVIELDEYFDFI